MNKYIFTFLIFLFIESESKIRLLTFQYNRPDFIEIQFQTFSKFLKEEHELIIFNDAKDEKMEKEIEQTCSKLNIQCVRFPQHLHEKSELLDEIERWSKIPNVTGLDCLNELKGRHPSIRHSHAIQYALENFGYEHDDIIGIIDGDMFLIREFSIREYLQDKDIIGIKLSDQTASIQYIWPGIVFFNPSKLPNKKTLRFNLSMIDNHVTDTGGHSYYYLHNNPTIKYKNFRDFNVSALANLNSETLKKKLCILMMMK